MWLSVCIYFYVSFCASLSLLSLYVHVHVVMGVVHGCMLWYGFGEWVYAVV